MRKTLIALVFVIPAFFVSCESENEKPDCSLVLCYSEPLSLKIRFIDKATDEDLIFSPTSKYSMDDIQVTQSSERNGSVKIELDTLNKIVIIQNIRTDDQIQLGNLPPDKIAVQYEKLGNECCSSNEINLLSIGELLVCEPCKNLDERTIVIRK